MSGLWRIFAVPLALAIVSVIGLVAALTGDGWRDWISWATLALPVAAFVWAWIYRRR
jgi:hypothetical protein